MRARHIPFHPHTLREVEISFRSPKAVSFLERFPWGRYAETDLDVY